MDYPYSKVAGIDVHSQIHVVTVMDHKGSRTTQQFYNSLASLAALRDWIVSEGCEVVAFESTGDYWRPLYETLSPFVDVIVAHPRDIKKKYSGKKTDKIDSEWIAYLTLHNMVPRSRIPSGKELEMRILTRERESLTNQRTRHQNKVNHILVRNGINLKKFVSKPFGKAGVSLIKLISTYGSVDKIIEHLPKKLRKHEERISSCLPTGLSVNDRLILQAELHQIDSLNNSIASIESRITSVSRKFKREISLLTTVPGIGYITAWTIIGEVGIVKDFVKAANLASWAGLTPWVNQSAGKMRMGNITKRGSTHLRRVLIQAAHAAARSGNNYMRVFFERVKKHSSYKKAIIALARKILTIAWNVLIRDEPYNDDKARGIQKKTSSKSQRNNNSQILSVHDAYRILEEAGEITKLEGDEGYIWHGPAASI